MPGSSSALLPHTGDVIDGKYALERLLGQGGMGAVYAARHIKLGHAVAIKVMLADAANHEAAQRFVNEGRAAANIQSDHVVRVSDVDEEHGYAYMVLELLDGEDLAQVLEREQRLPPHVAAGYVLQALEGVRQAHAQGIVHRDLKPANLFLAKRQDGTVVVKVLDFGISKANTSGLGMSPGALTSTKAMLGSPLYMSPEQLRSSKSVDARADIWAIGIILFELLTGTLPFLGENLGELFAAILETDAPNVQMRRPEVAPGLAAIVARCLQRRPEHRFQTVAELQRELAPFASPMGWPDQARGTGPHDAVVKGTVPLGAITPQPYPPMAHASHASHASSASLTGPLAPVAPAHPGLASSQGTHAQPGAHDPRGSQAQTGNTWQRTGGAPKGSNTGLIVGLVCATLALGGISLAAFAKLKGKSEGPTTAGSSASTAPPLIAVASEAPSQAPSASAPPVTTPAASVTAAPSTAPSATAATFAGNGSSPRHHPPPASTTTPTSMQVAPPVAVKPAPPPRPPESVRTAPPPPPPPPNGLLQGNR